MLPLQRQRILWSNAMNPETSSSRTNTLIAFFAGAAVGAVIVALTTPKRGAELRKDIADLGVGAKEIDQARYRRLTT
jgi:gas vesicle protein